MTGYTADLHNQRKADMGCFESKEERESEANNKEIEKLLKEDEEKMKDEVKMLLLGTSSRCSLNLF